nr:uncharacterized protein LOC107454337 [Parasteatoda tepidariorum]
MSDKSHSVMRLAVHLPNQQQIVYHSGHEVEAVARASTRNTTLTAWFEIHKTDVEACSYYYSDMPHYYVFDKSNRWKRRQRGGDQIIGRMPVVSIQDSERFYLRMLLLRKSGAISFDDLKTVNGNLCASYQQACRKLGFLEGDEHWHNTLCEASQIRMPRHLRMLFAVICGFGEIENIPELWREHRDLSEDFALQYSEETAVQYALAEISEMLVVYGLTLQKVNLPEVTLSEIRQCLPV